MRMVTLLAASWFLSCLTSAAVAERLRPRPDGLVDDFEGALRWRPRRDGGHPPAFEVSSNDPHGGRQCLRINYADRPPNWGSIEKEIAITGKETALVLWVRVERAEPKAAMHVWLMERDGDGWLARVKSDGQTLLADFPQGEWVRARIPLVDFEFQARGQGSRELSQVNVMVLNFNFASSTVYVDDIAFEVPPEVKADLLARQEKDERTRQQVISRIQPRGSRRGVVAIFRDVVPPPVEGRASDPEYLAQLLRSAGYGVAFLTAREMAAPGVLDPQVFDIVVLPYGPRFPGEAADTFRDYLTGGGRFISMGGYAFDELYSGGPESGRSQLIANGSFEEAGTDENQPSAWLLPQGAGLTVRRDNTRARTGSSSLYIAAADAAPVTWYIARQRLDSPAPSVRYLLSGFVRVRNIHDGPGAYIGVDFYRADGSRISFSQSHIVGRTEDWTQLSVEFSVPDGTAYMTANCILYARGEAWFDDIELRAVPASLNTRRATARDMLHISDDQIPVFDPSFRLDQVAELRAAERQFVASADLQIRADLEGYAAVGLWGKNTPVAPEPYARWVPLLRTYDQFGHLRGTAGALLFHHDGPWQGSTWAFFGITNVDLFRRGDDKMARFFLRLVDHMLRGIYLSCPEPALMCYRDGEQVSARVLVGNNGRRAAEVEVRAKILEGESGKLVAECPAQTVMLEPGNRATAEFAFPRFDFDTDLYEVRFTASAGDSPVDQVSTGFCVWHKDVVSRGPDVRWRDNYLHLGDAQAGTFLCGTNQTGVVLGPWWENPLAWHREFQYMHDWGLRVLRVLHISHFAGNLANPDEKFLRRMDALVYMTQRHQLILFPCMHDWLGGISIAEEVLTQEARFAQILSERYRDVPGVIIDVENEASVSANDHPELRGMFNDFLREVYGGDEQALRATWGEAARFGEVPFKSPPAPTDWADLRWLDLNLFRRRLVERWLRTNVEAMRAVNTRHPITDEYYLLPGGDAGEANRYCDFVNIHCYDIDRPEQLKYYDHAAEGMGFAVGEFSKRSHPSFVSGWGWAPEPEVRRWYMHLVSACLGAGGTLICNWDWKDMESCIFPWGLVYPCDLVPKGQFYVFRALSETLRHVKLTYAPPAVYVLIPDLHVLRGPDDLAGWLPARRCIAALLRIGVPFGVLHDTNIEKLPKEAKLVFYPSPFTLTDATFDWATQFVRRGGTLYVSGDLSYDERGRRTKASRLTELCGVEDGGALYAPRGLPDERLPVTPHIAEIESYSAAPCLTVKPLAASLLASAGDVPALLENSVGQGRVLLSTAPLELFADGPPRQLYEFVLSRAGIEQLRIDGDDGGLTIMLPPQRSGCLAALYREASTPAEVALLGARLRIIPRNWGIVATDETQTPYFLAGQGFVASDGFEVRAERDEPILVASDSPLGKTTSVTLAVVPVQVDPYRAVALQIRWAGASGISVEAGETADGKWRVLCTPKAERVGGNWKIEVPAGLIVRLQKR